VMDRNHDGRINDGSELFGVGTRNAAGQRAGNGYDAMALEDSNHDAKLNAADAHFNDLRLWVDANHDGVSAANELHTLAEYGITELNLQASAGTQVDHGNLLGLVSSYTTADGNQHAMADVWFAQEHGNAKEGLPVQLSDLLAAPAADLLPGAPAGGSLTAGAGTTATAGVAARGLLDDDEFNKNLPLI